MKEKYSKLSLIKITKIINTLNNYIPGLVHTITQLNGKSFNEGKKDIIEFLKKSGIKAKFMTMFNYKDYYVNSKNFNSFLIASTLSSIFIYYSYILFEINSLPNRRVKMLISFLIMICVFMMTFSIFKSNPILHIFRNEFHRFYSNHKIYFLLNFILIGLSFYYSQQINKYFLQPFFLVCSFLSLFLVFNSIMKENNIFSILLVPIATTGLFALYFYTFYKYNLRNRYHLTIFTIIFLVSVLLKSYSGSSLANQTSQAMILTLIILAI